jgi:hypothetical protein
MPNFDSTDERFRRSMFETGNRVRFKRPVDEAGQAWWLERFYDKYDLTPEQMGDLITRSVLTAKSIEYAFIDGIGEAFALRVEGRFSDQGEVWFVERTLNLRGNVFNADEMFVPDADAGSGRGSRLMADLIAASKQLDIARITLQARQIGRYAWLRMGFRPDNGSWFDLRRTLLTEIFRFEGRLGTELTNELARRIAHGSPETANFLAGLEIEVPSTRLRDDLGRPVEVPLGKALFLDLAGDWSGEYAIEGKDMKKIADISTGGGNDD